MCRSYRALPASFRRTSTIMLVSFVAVLVSFGCDVSARVVNISNTWILPQEGFPVFYRYFRDRISWYEADAVCQFHHASLVTVDNTEQYDAVRAYLKELDIATYVWVGLSRSDNQANFHWTGQLVLRGEGYWAAAPAPPSRERCTAAAADPVADFRWRELPCGGPDIASFVCELPVSAGGWWWAQRCSVRALPALTVEWVPERAAVRLTNDCGLAGVRQIYCTEHENQDDLLKNLSCDVADGDEAPSTEPPVATIKETNQGTIKPTTHKAQIMSAITVPMTSSQIVLSSTVISTPEKTSRFLDTLNISQFNVRSTTEIIRPESLQVEFGRDDTEKFVTLLSAVTYNDENNEDTSTKEPPLKSKETPTVTSPNVKYYSEFVAKNNNDATTLESHNTFTSKIVHNQPSDHFIPPLVMAMSKINADMNVLSAEEKHTQQISERKIYENKKKYINFDSTTQFQYPTTTRNIPYHSVTKQAEHKHHIVVHKQTKMESPGNIENDTMFKEFTESKKTISKKYNQFSDSLEKKTKKNYEMDKQKVVQEAITDLTAKVLYDKGLSDELTTERVSQELKEPLTPMTLAMAMEKNTTFVPLDPNLYNLNNNISIVNGSEILSNNRSSEVTSSLNSIKKLITKQRPAIAYNNEAGTELMSIDVATEVYDSTFNLYQDEPPRPSRSRKLTKLSPRPTRLRILGALG